MYRSIEKVYTVAVPSSGEKGIVEKEKGMIGK